MLRRRFSKKKEKKAVKVIEDEVLGSELTNEDEEEEALEELVTGESLKLSTALSSPLEKSKKDGSRDLPAQAAWQDDDDPDTRVGRSVQQSVSWATRKRRHSPDSEASDAEEDADILRRTGDYSVQSNVLPKGTITIKRCSDANKDGGLTIGKVKASEFHPSSQVILVAGMAHNVGIYQVDGKQNPKIQSLFMEKFPVFCAHFSQDGREVFMGSRAKGFYVYDMIAGRMSFTNPIRGAEHHNTKKFQVSPDGRIIAFVGSYGHINLVSTNSKEWIGSLKMNGSVESLTFSGDGSKMYSFGDDGEVYVWDMTTRNCVHRFTDDGCFRGTAITASRDDKYIAAGSYSGVVNLYNASSVLTNARPTPLKAFMNLTTPCTSLSFNSTSEILAVASDYKESALKLLHVPSLSAFSNFPDKADQLRIVTCCDFSTNSGYFTAGNHKGQALLYRVKHYSNY